MLNSDARREQIINIIKNSKEPVAGSELAKQLKVSRQVIVQDIALLRANDINVLATNKGYIIFTTDSYRYKRIIKVKHDDEHMREELEIIINNGAKVKNVIVEHDIYGQIAADLVIDTLEDIDSFIKAIKKSKSKPLLSITDTGGHFHTIVADSEKILNNVENELKQKKYLD